MVGLSSLNTFGSGLAVSAGGVMFLAGNGANGALRTVNRTTGITDGRGNARAGRRSRPTNPSVRSLSAVAASSMAFISTRTPRRGKRTC